MNTTLSAPMMSSGVSPPQPASVVILLTKPWKADWDLGNRKRVFLEPGIGCVCITILYTVLAFHWFVLDVLCLSIFTECNLQDII